MDGPFSYADFGRLVCEHRRRLRLTQEQLSLRIGLSRTSVTNIEKGRQKILLHQLYAIASALEVPPETLLPLVERPQISVSIAEKLDEQLMGSEKNWALRIVAGGTKGASSDGASKNPKS